MEEWREKIDPAVLREMNRQRVAKGLHRIRGRRSDRPLNGYFRYSYKHTRLKTTMLNNVLVTPRKYEKTLLGRHKTIIEIISRLWVNRPGPSGGR